MREQNHTFCNCGLKPSEVTLNFFHAFSMFVSRVAKRGCGDAPLPGMAQGCLHVALCALILPGCAAKREGYDVPRVALPAQYKNAAATTPAAAKNAMDARPNAARDAGVSEWWRSFGNPELIELVDRGLANNSDVRIATIRLAQAKARADQVHAGLLPTLSAPVGEAMGSVPLGTSAAGRSSQKSYQASLRGTWRADVWGEQSSLAESANFQLWRAAFESDNVQRNMTANLASNYVEFLSLNDRLRVAARTEFVLRRMLSATKVRVSVNDATLNDLNQQKATFFSARSVVHSLEQQRENALTNIAFLVGTVPESLKLSDDGLDALELPATIPALPSSLLFARPDVRMAEARLLAADADIDVARARILPPLDLSAQAGYSGLAMAQLFQPTSFFWNTIANVTVSIFDAGKLKSEKESAKAMHEEMVETYARTIYQAVSEVENALAGIRLTGERLNVQQKVTALARRAWGNSVEAYNIGSIDYMTLLEARRAYYRQQDEFQQIKMSLCRGYINLFQALGGGVNFDGPVPGKGLRPTQLAAAGAAASPKETSAGVDWDGEPANRDPAPYWQVELSGLYHRQTIDATWRDLKTRYPKLMENLALRPRLQGQIEDEADGRISWYRLYLSKFGTAAAAHELCAALQANYQRCRVTSSVSDETVAPPDAGAAHPAAGIKPDQGKG